MCKHLKALQLSLKKRELEEKRELKQRAVNVSKYDSITVNVGNSCTEASKEGFMNWKLFIRGDGIYNVGDRIKSVKVTLHPSFSENVFVLHDAPFELSRCGWGTFEIGLELEVYTNSSLSQTSIICLSHDLSFEPVVAQRTLTLTIPGSVQVPVSTSNTKKSEGHEKEVMTLYDDLFKEFGNQSSSSKAQKHIARSMHGTQGDTLWKSPVKVVHCDVDARPGYATRKAHEYNDIPSVLRSKVKLLADMVRKSKHMAAYTGAGISTASGIGDYASKAKNTTCGKNKKKGTSINAKPTLAHRVLASLYRGGYLRHWVQQNHDGLPQKAGFPQAQLNEIHGAWQDPSNPVVPMDGHLRSDLIDWLQQWEETADLCLVLGTSMCGMAADEFALAVNRNAHEQGNGLGMVVVSLQQTQHDHKSALRIFSKIDDVMALLVEELMKSHTDDVLPNIQVLPYTVPLPIKSALQSTFKVAYNHLGDPVKTNTKTHHMLLDLRPGAKIRVTRGVGKGFVGHVHSVKENGDFKLAIPLQRENHPQRGKKLSLYTLGRWWVQDAIDGIAKYLPVVNENPNFTK